MKQPNWFNKILDWIFTPSFNCSKGKHRWVYRLSDTGNVYLDESKVPKDVWFCSLCEIKRY